MCSSLFSHFCIFTRLRLYKKQHVGCLLNYTDLLTLCFFTGHPAAPDEDASCVGDRLKFAGQHFKVFCCHAALMRQIICLNGGIGHKCLLVLWIFFIFLFCLDRLFINNTCSSENCWPSILWSCSLHSSVHYHTSNTPGIIYCGV